jgi:hypothetical protein
MKTNFTKRLILVSLITIGFYVGAKAQSDDQSAYDDQYPQTQQQYTQPQQQYVQPQYTQPVDPQYDQSFDYYPDANVYYDNTCNRYIYNNGGAWLTVNVLPAGISLYGAPCYRVYHRGPQIWLDNAIHFRNFYRGGGYRPVVINRGGYRDGGWNGRQNFNHDDHNFNRGDRGSFNSNRGFDNARGFGGNRGGGERHATYRR